MTKELTKIAGKAALNKTQKSTYKFPNSDLKITLKYVPSSLGYEERYKGKTYQIYSEGELIGDLYNDMNGTFSMYSDKNNVFVSNLKEVNDIVNVWQDGQL